MAPVVAKRGLTRLGLPGAARAVATGLPTRFRASRGSGMCSSFCLPWVASTWNACRSVRTLGAHQWLQLACACLVNNPSVPPLHARQSRRAACGCAGGAPAAAGVGRSGPSIHLTHLGTHVLSARAELTSHTVNMLLFVLCC
jgi:hypothetical protein